MCQQLGLFWFGLGFGFQVAFYSPLQILHAIVIVCLGMCIYCTLAQYVKSESTKNWLTKIRLAIVLKEREWTEITHTKPDIILYDWPDQKTLRIN